MQDAPTQPTGNPSNSDPRTINTVGVPPLVKGTAEWKKRQAAYDVVNPVAARAASIRANYAGKELYRRRLAVFDAAIAKIDEERIAQVREKYAEQLADFHPVGNFKYFDVAYFLWGKTADAMSMDLDRRPQGRILDLGCGAGHFLALANALGFESVGLDIDVAEYNDLGAALGVARVICPIKARVGLKSFGQKFDIVTAMWTLFDRERVSKEIDRPWSLQDWRFFFDDLKNHMNPGATIFIEPNMYKLGGGRERYNEEFVDAVARSGGKVDRKGGACKITISAADEFTLLVD